MAGWTNKGKYRVLGAVLRAETLPANFYVALVKVTNVPDADTNVMSDLTEVDNGNGYTSGGTSLTKNSTDFDVWTEDDTNDLALMQIKDLTWTASGGSIADARYAVLTDANATPANREIWYYWDLGSAITATDGNAIRLTDLEIDITES